VCPPSGRRVLQYAVDVLEVKHVMVVGRYGCSGVRAAFRCERIGLADNWLRHVQDVKSRHETCNHSLCGEENRVNRLCELNVIEQVLQRVPDHHRARRLGTRPRPRHPRLDPRP